MKRHTLHSKLRELQGDLISELEKENFLGQILKVLDIRRAGEISISEAGLRIRKLAWKISEDLHLDGLALSSGTDRSLTEKLPALLKA